MTPLQRLREDAVRLVLGRRPYTAAEYIAHAMEGFLATALGGAVTPYDRHREAYVQTGDLEELDRMLRHVS